MFFEIFVGYRIVMLQINRVWNWVNVIQPFILELLFCEKSFPRRLPDRHRIPVYSYLRPAAEQNRTLNLWELVQRFPYVVQIAIF